MRSTAALHLLVATLRSSHARTVDTTGQGLDVDQIQIAFDGPSALQAARTFNPEIILLDIGLPGLNGREVARHLRKSPAGKHALIVVSSGYGRAEDRQHSFDAGLDRSASGQAGGP